ncbi:winged helix-turn-helix domain-containing protein [Actinoplanes hulinensis]|uniref:Winged helix-turn-helix domain-containing protein n=1 Tax=Actinoplanes hulinensis TaxID=1144547 RepID=A0ABS7BGD8_9ACTN|nr:BTAD domain-containing putative transcriptional regulator [Actinoplanes hulinensis]MBW6439946.1 winged helix-turn-helix domain-containing protein [Actinoplanes hulinensis]
MRIGMLGSFEVHGDDGARTDVPGARLRGLLIALALETGRVVPKAALVDWIWGGHPPADATNALHRLVSRLRKVLPDGAVEGHTEGYRLTVEPDAVDAVRFARLVTAAHARAGDDPDRERLLREALGLWRGPAMRDVTLPDSAAFGAAVTRLEELRLAALEDRYESGAGHPELVPELTTLVAAHPLRERLAAALMRALAAAGRGSEALLVYQRTREALADALGVDPSPELSALHVALLRGDARRPEQRRTNLRAELTSYVGKSADVAAVRELVAGHRLTTLTGPGGSGKTRLAAESARALLDDLPDGAWLVELTAIGPDGDVAQAALAGLGLRDTLLGEATPAGPLERLMAAVRDRETLLILDNCEHVIEAAAEFAHRVLGECPKLRILATSREPLGIVGEALWPVEPLALPADDGDAAGSPAVRLLRDRAGAVRKDLGSDPATLSTMVRVCRALDGMPLAIELAAARLRTMSLDQLAHRLDDRFRLLTGGSRTALPRHRTLRAVIDWSWELLSEAERTMLRRLSVFSGGASLEAAERVCGGDHLELLTSLTEKSLLVAEGDGAPRYRMLGTIREYAGDRLAEAGESEQARRAHLDWCTDLAETAEPHLRRAGQLHWLALLQAEHDNIGAAMRGALATGDAPAAMRLAAAAGWYWWLSGNKTEGGELILAATGTPGAVPDDIRATVYAIFTMFLTDGPGDEHRAAEWIVKAYELSRHAPRHHPLIGFTAPLERLLREPGAVLSAFEPLLDDPDPWARALARLHLGKMRTLLGHGGHDADAHLETALTEFRALGERFGISFALIELANRIATRGEFTTACGYYEEAIEVVTPIGAVEDVIRMRARQAQLYWLAGDREAAATALAGARRSAERVTWPGSLAELALAEARLAHWAGDRTEAYRRLTAATGILGDDAERPNVRAEIEDLLGYLTEDHHEAGTHRAAAYRAAVETSHAPLIAQVLVGVADQALRHDDPEQAARLLAASTAVRGLPDRAHPDAARIERAVHERLGEGFAGATADGTAADWRRLAEATLAPLSG